MNAVKKWNEEYLEGLLGRLLQRGVLLSASLVLVGGSIYLYRHGGEVTALTVFHGEPQEFSTVPGIFNSVVAIRGRGFIQLGLLVLIAVPVLRVLVSAYAFWRQRDWTYVVITLVVLGILLFSFVSESYASDLEHEVVLPHHLSPTT